MKKKIGLIGTNVSQSFSKSIFDEKFSREGLNDHHYDLYSLPNINELRKLLEDQPELCGLNVTVPYKEVVIELLDCMDSDAEKIGAVNVIKIEKGNLKGFNTDCNAFLETLERWLSKRVVTMALVLGSGGSSKAIQHALRKLGIPFKVVARQAGRGNLTYEELERNKTLISKATLIINCTPLGMLPKTNAMPAINCELLTSQHLVYDLIYNPARTLLLEKAEMSGASVKNGLEMLHIQAEKSWAIWSS